jgi:hypothetical protein
MADVVSFSDRRDEWSATEDTSLSNGYSFFHWFMMAGFVAFYALLLPINQRWFSNAAVSGLLWWTALPLGLVLLGFVVAACTLHWKAMTHAERVTRAWMISFVLLIFMGELFRRHLLWVEWMELPLTLVCGALGWWALHIGLQNHAERTNHEIRERLHKRAERAAFSRGKTISAA